MEGFAADCQGARAAAWRHLSQLRIKIGPLGWGFGRVRRGFPEGWVKSTRRISPLGEEWMRAALGDFRGLRVAVFVGDVRRVVIII